MSWLSLRLSWEFESLPLPGRCSYLILVSINSPLDLVFMQERITRHEAGHFLVAYLLGCPIQRCILRPVFSGGLVGQAGTIFYDKKLLEDVKKNKLSASSIDRYTTIVMAGKLVVFSVWVSAQSFGRAERTFV